MNEFIVQSRELTEELDNDIDIEIKDSYMEERKLNAYLKAKAILNKSHLSSSSIAAASQTLLDAGFQVIHI